MKALEIVEEKLRLSTRDSPNLEAKHVIIETTAAGINRADLLQRDGKYPPPPGASDIPGLEISGTVSELGPDVTSLSIGQEVCALLQGGGFAEYCAVHEDLVLPLPEGLGLLESASIPETYFTVWDNVFRRAKLSEGEFFLIHGGTSGIGCTAIQLAKAFGAIVISTSGSGRKAEACLALGADLALNYKTQDFVSEVDSFTSGHGADVILDMVGGDYFQRNVSSLATEGRLVQIGLQQGSKVELLLHVVMQKRLSIMGSTLRARSVVEKRPIARDLKKLVWPLFESGQIKPVVQGIFSFEEANAALEIMERGELIGKLVLTP